MSSWERASVSMQQTLPSGTGQLVAVLIQDLTVPFRDAGLLILPCLPLSRGHRAAGEGLPFFY